MGVRFRVPRLWELHGITWKELASRVLRKSQNDDVLGQAAKLSFYLLLALFPMLIVFTTLFGFFAQSVELRAELLSYFRHVVPPTAFRLVDETLFQITEGAGSGKLSLGILGSLFAASSGMVAIIEGLNTAYGIREQRPWWRVRLTALWLTIGFSLFTCVALLLILLGPRIGHLLPSYIGYSEPMRWLWDVGRWPIVIVLVMLTVNLLFRYAPDLKGWTLPFLTPGALITVLLWLLASWGFRAYLHFFDTYNATYGSLGAVVILMLWLYLTGAAILIGAEVNSEIEHAAAESGEPGARLSGEREPGEKARERELLGQV
jgi:membrane protein